MDHHTEMEIVFTTVFFLPTIEITYNIIVLLTELRTIIAKLLLNHIICLLWLYKYIRDVFLVPVE